MSSGTKLSEITYTNRLQSFGGKRFAQFIDKIEVFKNPENITFTTTYQYDSYGNATYVKESCPIRTIETTNNYALYGGWGPYNRLTSSTVKTTYSGKTSYIRSISFSYDSKGNLIREITDNGVTKDYTVNPLGVITGITIKASDEPASSTRFDYDSGYRFVIKTTNALGQVNSQLIDPRTGVVLNDIAINGLKTDYIYDGFGRLVKIKTPEGNTITINRIGNPSNAPQGCAYAIETISEGKPKSKVFYDILDREIRSEVEGPSGIIVTEKNYNAKGQLISETSPHYITDPAITTTYKYDVFGRVTAVSRNGRTTTNSYSGTKVTTTTPDGKKYTKEFNSLGNLVSATDNGGSISYSYHSSGQVQTISANGLITSIEYDNFGRQLSITDPSAGKVEYTYYPSGKLKSQKDARGNTYTYTYDALGRIVSASGPDENISYSYETSGGGNGLISSISNSLNSTKKIYKYDSFGRISEFTDKIGDVAMVSSFKYDKYGNITKHTFPSGFVINKTYDSKSNLIQITNDNGGIIWKFVSETATGQPLEYQLGSLLNVNYAYDSDEFLTAISTFANPMPMINSKAFPGDYPLPQGLVLSYSYSFDPLTGNLNWRKDNILNLQEVFTYDNLNRLEKIRMGASEKLVRYEKNGNISFKSDAGMYTYNGYRVTEVASATNNIPTLTQNITYNGFGKVQTIEEGTSSLNFIYGTDRQRIKTIETKGSLTTTRYYTLDHEREVSTTTTDRSYIYSPYGLVAVVEKQADTYTTLLVSTDHLGSIVGLFTTDGKLVQKLSYDAWGNYRNPANYSLPFGEVPRLRRGFTGHEHEPLFGIINMNGRVYDPVLGRFLSPDNFVQAPDFTQNFNRYAYCLNNPLKYTDPTGEIFVIDDILFAAAIGAIINVAVQGMSGHINSAGDFFMAAGIGALAGAGGAFVGGAVAGAIGYGGFAGGATIGAASGFAGGFIGGAGNSWMNGSNFGDGLVAGLKGGLIGGISGGLIGGTIAGIDAVRSGSDFWNGSVNEVGGSGFGTFLDEEIPAGAKPTATGEIAETSTNPNYGKYGMTRNGGAKAHYGVDYAGKEGDDVFAMYDGKVIKIGGSKEYGENFVRTSSTINGKTYNVDYGHMSKSVVSINKMVSAGEKIGEMGRLGNLAGTSFPTHVHIAVWRPVNGLQGFVMPWWK